MPRQVERDAERDRLLEAEGEDAVDGVATEAARRRRLERFACSDHGSRIAEIAPRVQKTAPREPRGAHPNPLCPAANLLAESDWIHAAEHDLLEAHCRARHLRARRLLTIYDGIATAAFAPGGGAAVRRELGIPPDAPLAGIVGHIQDWKGQHLVVEAVARVLPGAPLIEAMAIGRPVIAPREGGPLLIVVDGETGLLVPPRDAGASASTRCSTSATTCAPWRRCSTKSWPAVGTPRRSARGGSPGHGWDGPRGEARTSPRSPLILDASLRPGLWCRGERARGRKRAARPPGRGARCTSEWASFFKARAKGEPIATSTGTSCASAISPSRSGSNRCGASNITSPTTRCAPTSSSTSRISPGARNESSSARWWWCYPGTAPCAWPSRW